MSKRGVSGIKRKTSSKSSDLKIKRFVGLALSGGKADKAALAVMEYYPSHKKIFLSQLFENIRAEGEISADQQIVDILTTKYSGIEGLAIDVPLKLPKCMRCRLTCPGYEKCKEPEILWMWKQYRTLNEKRKPKKLFTPYTERCAETYIANNLEEKFHPSHALGANLAPLVARGLFLKRRLKLKTLEVYARLSLWRVGRSLGIQKSYLRYHKHSVEGSAIRKAILEKLTERNVAFLYTQDTKTMVENAACFDAFICALTAALKFVNQCEKRPADFPKSENWVEFPQKKISWNWCQGTDS